MPETESRPINIFISYARDDERWREHFLDFLKPIARRGLVDTFTDEDIRASDRWEQAIDNAMETADVGLLLVSPKFLSSDFIMETELPYFVESLAQGKCSIVWVLLEDCLWNEVPHLAQLQAVNSSNDRPLASYRGNGRSKETVGIIKELLEVGQSVVDQQEVTADLKIAGAGACVDQRQKASELVNSLSIAENQGHPGVALLESDQRSGKETVDIACSMLRIQHPHYMQIGMQPDIGSSDNDRLYERLRRDLEWGLESALNVKKLTGDWSQPFVESSGKPKELFRDSVEKLVDIANTHDRKILLVVTRLERVDQAILIEWSAMLHDLCRYGLRILARGGKELRKLISTAHPGASAFHELLAVELDR